MATPVLQITIDGQDVSSTIFPRVLEGSVTRHDGEKADQFSLTLSNYDGRLAKPKRGATLTVALGFVEFGGPVDRGSYIVQQVTKIGPVAVFHVTGHSADLKKTLKTQKNRSWTAPKTLGDVLRDVARDNGLTAAIDPQLAQTKIDTIVAQTGESDMHLVTRLARRYGAIAKVAQGKLSFVPRGAGTAASGQALSAGSYEPADFEAFRIVDSDRDVRGKSKCRAWDRSKARGTTYDGSAGDDGPDYLHPETFGSVSEAKAAAPARAKAFARGKKRFEGTLRAAAPVPVPGSAMTTAGFGDDDDQDWVVKTVSDRFSGSGGGGLTTHVEGEPKT